jgi:hypothetical protein
MGRQTFALRITADGVLQHAAPVLTYDNLAKVVVGKTTREEARALLGPPYRVERMARQNQDSWEYWMVLDTVPMHVWILSSDDGTVRGIVKGEDLPRVRGRRN